MRSRGEPWSSDGGKGPPMKNQIVPIHGEQGRRQIFGDETAGVTRRAIDDKVEVSPHDVGPPRDPGELSSDPCAIALYASRPLSPGATQHSLPSGRYPLLGPVFHRLDRTSLPGALIRSPRRRRRAAPKEVGMPGHFVLSWSPARTRGR